MTQPPQTQPRMTVRRQLQVEFNALVPAALARGIDAEVVSHFRHESTEFRRRKLEELRALLGSTAVLGEMTFGVELECFIPANRTRHDLAAAIFAAGVPAMVEMYGHSVRDYWKLVTDGSLQDYNRGTEVVSPVLRGEDGFVQLRKVCAVLVEFGCKVRRSCGLHVHVGARGEGVHFFKNLVKMYAHAQVAIDSFMAPSRRSYYNSYCHPLYVSGNALEASSTVDEVARASHQSPGEANARNHSRYAKLNLQSFWQHGTVEFRHHQGTVEGPKVENWVRLCLRMSMAARTKVVEATTVDALLAEVEASESERAYFIGRVNHFARREQRAAA
jgi:hypothetical protein